MHKPALVDSVQAFRHINEDLRHVLRQDRILPRVEQLQVFRLHIIHDEIIAAVLDIADDVFVAIELRENFVALLETAPGGEVEAQLLLEPAQRINLAARIGNQPDVRHAAAVEQFTQIEPPELLRGQHVLGIQPARHSKVLPQKGSGGDNTFAGTAGGFGWNTRRRTPDYCCCYSRESCETLRV